MKFSGDTCTSIRRPTRKNFMKKHAERYFLVIRSRTYLVICFFPLLNLVYALMHLQIKALHQFDCLRANKSTSAWGVEARVPFLDKEFLNVAMSIDPEWKMIKPDLGRIEKWVLRNAFDDEQRPYLPKVCLQIKTYLCSSLQFFPIILSTL